MITNELEITRVQMGECDEGEDKGVLFLSTQHCRPGDGAAQSPCPGALTGEILTAPQGSVPLGTCARLTSQIALPTRPPAGMAGFRKALEEA